MLTASSEPVPLSFGVRDPAAGCSLQPLPLNHVPPLWHASGPISPLQQAANRLLQTEQQPSSSVQQCFSSPDFLPRRSRTSEDQVLLDVVALTTGELKSPVVNLPPSHLSIFASASDSAGAVTSQLAYPPYLDASAHRDAVGGQHSVTMPPYPAWDAHSAGPSADLHAALQGLNSNQQPHLCNDLIDVPQLPASFCQGQPDGALPASGLQQTWHGAEPQPECQPLGSNICFTDAWFDQQLLERSPPGQQAVPSLLKPALFKQPLRNTPSSEPHLATGHSAPQAPATVAQAVGDLPWTLGVGGMGTQRDVPALPVNRQLEGLDLLATQIAGHGDSLENGENMNGGSKNPSTEPQPSALPDAFAAPHPPPKQPTVPAQQRTRSHPGFFSPSRKRVTGKRTYRYVPDKPQPSVTEGAPQPPKVGAAPAGHADKFSTAFAAPSAKQPNKAASLEGEQLQAQRLKRAAPAMDQTSSGAGGSTAKKVKASAKADVQAPPQQPRRAQQPQQAPCAQPQRAQQLQAAIPKGSSKSQPPMPAMPAMAASPAVSGAPQPLSGPKLPPPAKAMAGSNAGHAAPAMPAAHAVPSAAKSMPASKQPPVAKARPSSNAQPATGAPASQQAQRAQQQAPAAQGASLRQAHRSRKRSAAEVMHSPTSADELPQPPPVKKPKAAATLKVPAPKQAKNKAPASAAPAARQRRPKATAVGSPTPAARLKPTTAAAMSKPAARAQPKSSRTKHKQPARKTLAPSSRPVASSARGQAPAVSRPAMLAASKRAPVAPAVASAAAPFDPLHTAESVKIRLRIKPPDSNQRSVANAGHSGNSRIAVAALASIHDNAAHAPHAAGSRPTMPAIVTGEDGMPSVLPLPGARSLKRAPNQAGALPAPAIAPSKAATAAASAQAVQSSVPASTQPAAKEAATGAPASQQAQHAQQQGPAAQGASKQAAREAPKTTADNVHAALGTAQTQTLAGGDRQDAPAPHAAQRGRKGRTLSSSKPRNTAGKSRSRAKAAKGKTTARRKATQASDQGPGGSRSQSRGRQSKPPCASRKQPRQQAQQAQRAQEAPADAQPVADPNSTATAPQQHMDHAQQAQRQPIGAPSSQFASQGAALPMPAIPGPSQAAAPHAQRAKQQRKSTQAKPQASSRAAEPSGTPADATPMQAPAPHAQQPQQPQQRRRVRSEIDEHRREINRASASRFHFRRKAEMEQLEKDCEAQQAQVASLKQEVECLRTKEAANAAMLKALHVHVSRKTSKKRS